MKFLTGRWRKSAFRKFIITALGDFRSFHVSGTAAGVKCHPYNRSPHRIKGFVFFYSVLREEGIPEEDFAEDELGTVYLALLQRAAFTLFSLEDDERSFEIVQELMRHNLDDQGSVRSLYYRIRIQRTLPNTKKWRRNSIWYALW